MSATAFSPGMYRFFVIAAILWGIGLVLGNDIIPFWPGEATLLNGAGWSDPGVSYPIPYALTQFVGLTLDYDVFGLRLIGVICLLKSLLAIFHWGSRLFGRSTSLVAILVSMSLFLPAILGKTFSPEIVLLPFQTTFALALLYFLKTGKSRLWVYSSFILGTLCTPFSMLIYAPLLYLGLRYRHPDGEKLTALRLLPVIIGVGLIKFLIIYLMTGNLLSNSPLFTTPLSDWLILQLASLLPWLGFALAGFWHTLRRVGKADELVTIVGTWLVAALLSGGLVLQLAIAVLIARQVGDLYRPGYPYKPLIIFGSVIQLVSFFFLATYGMMTGFQELGGTGFRVGMALGLVYWIPGVFGLVGLWSKGPGLLIGGRVLSGVLVLLVGWLMLFPIVAKELGWKPPSVPTIELQQDK